jgi:glycosyltransferase involved in cell wall biosynthesis
MLPISVLVPTRNSMALLPRHLDTMDKWLDLVAEVVVVDSDSTDGTLELLKRKLTGDRVRILRHPPGLYASWNHGIQQLRSQYTYISTVGDEMSREGLFHLAEVAGQFSSDVVVSPPVFVNERGALVNGNPWPVHDLISYLELGEPICLDGFLTFVFALSFVPFAILGSSASNLYRTSVLQRHPFPTEYGGNGDGAWGVQNGLNVRFAITPKRVSYFRRHRRPYRRSELVAADGDRRMMESGLRLVEQLLRERPDLRIEAEQFGLERFTRAKLVVQQWRTKLIWYRSLPLFPWTLNPLAWYVRCRRNAAQRVCQLMFKELLASCLDRRLPAVSHPVAAGRD